MRTIKYIVEGQTLNTNDDLRNIYVGSQNYLELEFEFDSTWDECAKAVVFIKSDKSELPKLLKDNKCIIPNDICKNKNIRFYLVGKTPKFRIQTQKKLIRLG